MGSSTSMQQRPMIEPMAEPEVSPQKNALGNEGDDEQHDRVERMVKEYTRLVERILSRRKMQNAVDLSGGNSNKCIMTFPQKLYLILKMAPSYGFDHIISWQPHGRSFVIRKRDLFVSTIASR
jgi:HSF-type DNA-binding